MKKIHFIGQEKFLPGMAEIQNQLGFVLDENGYEVSCRQGGDGITVDVKDHKAAVTYGKDLKDRYTVLWLYYDLFGGVLDVREH